MERLTKRDLVNGIPCCYPQNDSGLGEIITKSNPYRKIIEKLKYYEDLEEQGLMKIFPCKAGDTVYFISERVENQGRRKGIIEFVDNGIVDNITLGSTMVPQITVCNDENIWTTFDSVEDFGKIIFLSQVEAKEALPFNIVR